MNDVYLEDILETIAALAIAGALAVLVPIWILPYLVWRWYSGRSGT